MLRKRCFSTRLAWPNSQITLGIPKETWTNEKRVAATPETTKKFRDLGFSIVIQERAGEHARFLDQAYIDAGATVVPDAKTVFSTANVILKVRPPNDAEIDLLQPKSTLISFLWPAQNPDLIQKLVGKGVTALANDAIPRTSVAQSYDVLSSMANISGYKAVVLAANHFGRFFTGQITAAGRVPPAKVFVIGAGVAGLAAIGAARSMGAVVRAFDTRPPVKEQVESMGAQFLEIQGVVMAEGKGGYAAEQGEDVQRLQNELTAKQAADVDIIITTALIPGRPAPKLITKDMVDSMKPGSVIVDLAAENGGNCESTVPGDIIVTPNHVTIIGLTDLPSLLPTQSSTLYANNVFNFVTAGLGPRDQFLLDMDDVVTRGATVVLEGKNMFPPPPLPEHLVGGGTKKPQAEPEKPAEPVDLYQSTLKTSVLQTAAVLSILGYNVVVPEPSLLQLLVTFSLSGVVGFQVVKNVAHSLHAPLMSVTNAVSGLTAVGGMFLMNGGMLPANTAGWLALSAVFVSAINIGGGFLITQRMLDMFKRPTDPKEYNFLYALPAAGLIGGYGLALQNGMDLSHMAYLVSSLCCIGAIGGLASPTTARMGNALGVTGVLGGIVTTLGVLAAAPALYVQMAGALAAGGAIGLAVARRMPVTSLPQWVAAFHSFVGLAAVLTCGAQYLTGHFGGVEAAGVVLGTFIGGITFTGSIIAFLKLNGSMSSKALALPGKNMLNVGMLVASVGAAGVLCVTGDMTMGLMALGALGGTSMLLGLHTTSSIGGADMPVVVTVLNSYSGWALCAEGFMLDNDLLTVAGALIGSSGAILSHVMCVGMGRDIKNVLFGSWGDKAAGGAEQVLEGEPTEWSVDAVAGELAQARKVLIVPGYGLAVAGAQFAVAQLAKSLVDKGISVTFGIHPVAGRMPGQLNVLLADAGVDYEIVQGMEDVNAVMDSFDVTLVIGANDTVSMAAENDPNSTIYGMPVIQVWNSKQIIIMKRSMATGYAGSQNPLFVRDNAGMLLGDALMTSEQLSQKVKSLL